MFAKIPPLMQQIWQRCPQSAIKIIALSGGLWLLLALLVQLTPFQNTPLSKKHVTSAVFLDHQQTLLRQEMSDASLRAQWIPLHQVSKHFIHAVLASEDHRFYSHNGVDWWAMLRATRLNIKQGTFSYGGSTITMQLVRLTAGTPRTLTGKMRQLLLAMKLETLLNKKEILEQYINRAYFGNGAWGANQAAWLYFEKSAQDLSLGEAAMLAVFPRSPGSYNPYAYLSKALKRRTQILYLMQKRGYITQSARQLAKRAPLSLQQSRSPFLAPHLVQYAKTLLPKDFSHGATIQTTLDLPLQQAIEREVAHHVDRLTWRNLTQAAVVVIRNSDGAILSMVGSRNYHDYKNRGAFNGALATLRPGSTLKPFVYGAAFELGDTPATIAFDVKLPEDAHQFYTKDVRSHGYARYRESLAGSFNLSAVHTLQRVGIKNVLQKLRDAGLSTLSKPDELYDWGLAIGHAQVRLLDLTAAFSTFGREGVPIAPRAVSLATLPNGQTWREPVTSKKRIFSKEIAYLIFDILSDPDARRPMFGTSVPMNLPFKVALKTGTTKAFTDLWALGTTHEYTVGVWAGNFNGEPTHQVRSVHGATPLMRAIYTAIANRFGYPTAPKRPKSVVTAAICPVSGKRPSPLCPHTKLEYFVSGNLPKERCDWHKKKCDEIYVDYPAQLSGWTKELHRSIPTDCITDDHDTRPLQIISPAPNAHFVLEPHRPNTSQRPPLHTIPPLSKKNWTINGTPAAQWIPHPGDHTATVKYKGQQQSVQFHYE